MFLTDDFMHLQMSFLLISTANYQNKCQPAVAIFDS